MNVGNTQDEPGQFQRIVYACGSPSVAAHPMPLTASSGGILRKVYNRSTIASNTMPQTLADQ